jgi:TonB family protein
MKVLIKPAKRLNPFLFFSAESFRFEIGNSIMSRYILCGFFFFIFLTMYGQEPDTSSKGIKAGFGVSVTQVLPEFPGGPDSLNSFLKTNLVYPDSARIKHIQGKVYIGFMVDRNGKVHNPRILNSIDDQLNEEALRVVKMMPDWKPGTAGGTPINVQYILPIEFVSPPRMYK